MSERGPDDTAEMPQPTIFSRIIEGELPGRFVWRDADKVAFLTIAPLRPGHVLVVPVEPIDHWLDVPAPLWAEMNDLAWRCRTATCMCCRSSPSPTSTLPEPMAVPQPSPSMPPPRPSASTSTAPPRPNPTTT